MMKNWLPAEFGIIVRAMERTPGVCFRLFVKPLLENSPWMLYPGPADTGSFRISALDHETSDDTVEDHTVIKSFVYQRDEIIYWYLGRFPDKALL